MNKNQISIDQLPKQFSENIVVGSNDQTFVLIVTVGVNANAYAISPEHAKNLVKVLGEHIQKFEADVRPIRDIAAGVKSPIQQSELGAKGKNDTKDN
ncbi:MAG: hypothetical protein ACYCZ0_03680 [Minisyncoccota bacterium]